MTVGNPRYTRAELEAKATIRPVKVSGGRKERMGCPFHGSDNQRSLELNLETGRYHCFTCGKWGYLSDQSGNRWGPPGRGSDRESPNFITRDTGFRSSQDARTAPQKDAKGLQVRTRAMESARRHLEDAEALAYLKARCIPLELAREYGLGYFPPGRWPGGGKAAEWGRVAFSLEISTGELVGVYSRAIDPAYPGIKAPKAVRHDVWGRPGRSFPILDGRAYGGYLEPSDQWEAEGRVTLAQACRYSPSGSTAPITLSTIMGTS